MNEPVLWINAGGTIVSKGYPDPHHPPKHVEPLPPGQALTLMEDCLQPTGVWDLIAPFRFGLERFRKDSKAFTDTELQALAEIIREDDHRLFLVTHGTDALAPNAETVQKLLGKTDKTVLFTGAMVPLSMKASHTTDADANLAYALENIDRLAPGVHIIGRNKSGEMAPFNPTEVDKDPGTSLEKLQLTFGLRTRPR